jgi:hypothetical protein
MKLIRQKWSKRAALIAGASSEFTFRFSKCVTEKQANWRQKQIARPIPQGIRDFGSEVASRLELRWEIKPEISALESFDDDFPTSGEFESNFFETDPSKLDGWEDSFTNWQNYRSAPNPFDFDELFPVFGIMTGDLIVELIGDRERGAIYYLDHESGSGDWKRLADTYEEFLSTLHELWFPGFEWHDCLEKFHDPIANRLSAETPFAKRWNAFMAEVTASTC